ncbi:RagB/SusD family nutrient uptake outer membrane protein [Pedobacter hartonius]|uniref:Starch-binding associating with outer membrane n=1 Tax=Pedobacter hartonius TaxID=425514 RepID=A0A1H4F775_9SPHI|nr:RagB/SusD family nutrient uptake outer membrane protein [Pedobacter hartonius]SEA92648.1 Starch-binding associating with outer membrane [Pedobacter hartonius]
MKNIQIRNRVLTKGLMLMAVLTVFSATSCKKYTELNPINSFSEATAFSTPASIELVMAGVYNTATVGTYNGTTGRGYPFGGASIIQAEMRGEDMVNLEAFYQITYESTITSNTANNINMWSNLYALINQCNVLIEGVTAAAAKGTITTAVADQYAGEARFLRALAHHELVIDFCRPYVDGNGSNPGVPYRTVAITSIDKAQQGASVARGTVAQDYVNILADLDFAESKLPAARTALKITRATQGAAIALKTRVKLHMEDWPGVIAEGAKLGTSAAAGPYTSAIGSYSLTASVDGPFSNFKDNTESMFSIENGSASNGGVNGALPNMFGPAANALTTLVGRNLVATSPNLYVASFWVTGDSRRSLLQIQQTTANALYFFNYKYRDPLNSTDYAPIIRYAEVLLNVAEAYSRTTALDTRALNLLNAVRNRAVPVANRFTIANFPSQTALTQAILNERRVEFAGEGRRWPDITRLSQNASFAVTGGGIPAKVLKANIAGDGSGYNIITRPVTTNGKAAIAYTDIHYIWPIPLDELNANPNIAQNPGY